jgi:hypothetical protein
MLVVEMIFDIVGDFIVIDVVDVDVKVVEARRDEEEE